MAKLVLFGKGEMAEIAHFYFTHDSPHQVVAFCLDSAYIQESHYLGLPMVPFEQVQELYPPDEFGMYIALGYKKLNTIREQKYHEAKAKGYQLASYISSKATQWNTEVGENTFIMEGNNIMPFCSIGNNVTCWIGNILAHHATVSDHVTITSHVAMGGNVIIEPNAFLGLNSTLRSGIRIAKKCIISQGANVVKDTEEMGVYFGNPAQKGPKRSDEINL